MKIKLLSIAYLLFYNSSIMANICKDTEFVDLYDTPLGIKISTLKASLPHTNGVDDTRMDDVILNGKNLCYEFTLTETKLTEYFSEQFVSTLKNSFVKYHCKEELIIPFIKNGGTMYYFYQDKHGTFFPEIKIDNTDCLIK